MRSLTILGSTGSIGTQTIDVAKTLAWRVDTLVAGRNAALLVEQAHELKPRLVVCDEAIVDHVRDAVPPSTSVAAGREAVLEAAAHPVDTVVAAIPGMAGVAPVLAAVEAGRHVALATKEAMVVAGDLVWTAARASGATLTPVDSEHAGVAQLLVGEAMASVESIVLTASGGPFREGPEDLSSVTREQALAHPTWAMGPRVTIDSATLFNKGLEVIEAHALFGLPFDAIEVVVHPQSLVHAFVRYRDGSLKAHVGPHDMRLAILWGIEGTNRPALPYPRLPLEGVWQFEPPDLKRFPALALAYDAGRAGGTAPAVLNAADEVAVGAFLAGRLPFPGIAEALRVALERVPSTPASWDAIVEADRRARVETEHWIAGQSS